MRGGGVLEGHSQLLALTNRSKDFAHPLVETTTRRHPGAQRVDAVPHERSNLEALQWPFEELAQFRRAPREARFGDNRDVVAQRRLQPHTLCGFRINEQERTNGTVGVVGMHNVWADDEAGRHPPVAVPASNAEAALDGQDDLDGVMLVGRNNPLGLSDGDEAAIPHVPVWSAGPTLFASNARHSRFVQENQRPRSIAATRESLS